MPIIKVECYTMNFIWVVKVSFMKKSFVVQRRMFALKIMLYCNRFFKKKFCTSPNIVLDGMLSFNKHISLYQNVCFAKKKTQNKLILWTTPMKTIKNLCYFLVAINLNNLQMPTNFDYKSSFWTSALVS